MEHNVHNVLTFISLQILINLIGYYQFLFQFQVQANTVTC